MQRITIKKFLKKYKENNYKVYGFGLWAVALRETGEFIGDCGLTIQNIDGESLPEIGYHIYKNHWRKVKEYPDEKNGISYACAIKREEWEKLLWRDTQIS